MHRPFGRPSSPTVLDRRPRCSPSCTAVQQQELLHFRALVEVLAEERHESQLRPRKVRSLECVRGVVKPWQRVVVGQAAYSRADREREIGEAGALEL